MMFRGIAAAAAAFVFLSSAPSPARADYEAARRAYAALPERDQTAMGLALIATGDFEGLLDFGFSRGLYRAVLSFERRNGLNADGLLRGDERMVLSRKAQRFFDAIGSTYETHPASRAKLLVPLKLFGGRKTSGDGFLYDRPDGAMSLSFVAFPAREKSYDALYRAMSARSADRNIIYTRKFRRYFVVTGTFHGSKFYSWMSRSGSYTSGFTYSWNDASNRMGRKISTLLANSFIAGPR